MTRRANQSLACAGILLILLGIAVTNFVKAPSGVEVGDDDDSGDGSDDDSGDDDSAPFSNLPPIPKD
jgi:hypothetical protein